jgi:hypothetical protein
MSERAPKQERVPCPVILRIIPRRPMTSGERCCVSVFLLKQQTEPASCLARVTLPAEGQSNASVVVLWGPNPRAIHSYILYLI